MRRKGVSQFIALIITIAIVLSVGAFTFMWSMGLIKIGASQLQIEVTGITLRVDSSNAYLTVNIKNTGDKSLAGAYVYGFDDNGKKFTLALPSLMAGQSGGNSLIIPLHQLNIVLDASGNNHHGYINNPNWVTYVNGKYWKGVELPDIKYGCIRVFNFPRLLGDKTISAWIYPTSWNRGTIAATTDPGWGKNGYAFTIESSGRLYFRIGDGNTAEQKLSRTNFIGLNRWNFATSVYDANGDTVTFYSGKNRDGPYQFTTVVNHVSGPTLFTLGEDCSGNECGFPGVLDELVIYDAILTSDEVSFNAQDLNVPHPITRNLVLWLTFDEGSYNSYSFTIGKTYSIIVVYYSLDGSIKEMSVSVQAKAF